MFVGFSRAKGVGDYIIMRHVHGAGSAKEIAVSCCGYHMSNVTGFHVLFDAVVTYIYAMQIMVAMQNYIIRKDQKCHLW